jgi:hypothetical protein
LASKSRPTQLKRQRERNQAEKQSLKAARRLEAKARRGAAPRPTGGEEPHLAGIRPGPQPRRDDEFPFE